MFDETCTSYKCFDIGFLCGGAKKKKQYAEDVKEKESVRSVEDTIEPQKNQLPSSRGFENPKANELIKTEEIKIHLPISDREKDTPRIFNLKKDIKKIPSSGVTESKDTRFSDADLQKAWKNFRNEKSNWSDKENSVLSKLIKKGEGSEIILKLSSPLEINFLEELEAELVCFLRGELRNDQVVIRKEIEEMKERKKIYTSKDIFEEMVKQNPSLKDFQEKLGLDFDY